MNWVVQQWMNNGHSVSSWVDIYGTDKQREQQAKLEQAKCAREFSVDAVDSETTDMLESGVPSLKSLATGFVVYVGRTAQGQRYIGITMDLARRTTEHARDGMQIAAVAGLENLTYFEAKAVEQVMIEQYNLAMLANKINSVAITNPLYLAAKDLGTKILDSICLP